jgi:hypothetical protein
MNRNILNKLQTLIKKRKIGVKHIYQVWTIILCMLCLKCNKEKQENKRNKKKD